MACMIDYAVSFLGSLLILAIYVTHVLFCYFSCLHLRTHAVEPVQICLHLRTHAVDPVQICLHLRTHAVDPVQICLQNQSWMSFSGLAIRQHIKLNQEIPRL